MNKMAEKKKGSRKRVILIGNDVLEIDFSDVRKVVNQLERKYKPNYQRNKKEITIFIQKLKDIWLKNPQVPFAQLIGYALRYGFCSFKKDIEVVLNIERLYGKKRILISPEIKRIFDDNNLNFKKRRYQITFFLGKLRKAWRRNSCMPFSELAARAIIGENFRSFKTDEEIMENLQDM